MYGQTDRRDSITTTADTGSNKVERKLNTVNSPIKAPLCFLRGTLTQNFTFLAISEPKMVRFSFCKKSLEAENALYSAISLLTRPAPLLENLRYMCTYLSDSTEIA